MSLMLHDDTDTPPTTVPALAWLVTIAAVAVAATLLLLFATIIFQGLDRLLPAGAPFLPYFTT